MNRLAKASGVTYKTVHKAAKKGEPIRDHDAAQRLANQTRGDVSVDEIVYPHEPEKWTPAVRARWKRRKRAA